MVFQSNRDRERHLSYLESAHDRYGAVIHTYCLMGNHYHLLLETPRGNLSQIIHHINGAYTTYFNIKRDRSGHFFQGRFKGIVVDKDAYCKELSRYIHLNPVRAGMVRNPSEYPWSSYRCYIGKERKPQWLTMELVLGDFGGEGRIGYKRYKEYVERREAKEFENPLKNVIASTFLGSAEFINAISGEYVEKKKLDKRNIPAIKRVFPGPSQEEIEKATDNVLGKDNALYKKMCIYLCHEYSGKRLDDIGAHFGMKGIAVSQLVRRFKQMLKRDKELREALSKIREEELSNVET